MTEAESTAADLKANGQPMILARLSPGTRDLVAGRVTDPIPQQWEVYGITKNYGSVARLASQGLIESGDKLALIDASAQPQTGDTLRIMGTTWRVVAVDDVSPQGETLMYNLQLRR